MFSSRIPTVTCRIGIVLFFAACGSAGPYGHAPEYAPLSEEETVTEDVTEVTYEDLRRDPAGYASSKIAWFGVVTSVGEDHATLTFRTLSPRNLCRTERDSSCRVTVNAREGGEFRLRFNMLSIDDAPVQRGSLLRVVGSPDPQASSEEAPVIVGEYVRHWPPLHYVTTAARRTMRR